MIIHQMFNNIQNRNEEINIHSYTIFCIDLMGKNIQQFLKSPVTSSFIKKVCG